MKKIISLLFFILFALILCTNCSFNNFATKPLKNDTRHSVLSLGLLSEEKDLSSFSVAFDSKTGHTYKAKIGGNSIDVFNSQGILESRITKVFINSKEESFDRIKQLHITDGLLYVALIGSCRVDVIDTFSNSSIMSLGTGTWQNGSNPATLTHPKGVIQTGEYVIVAHQSNTLPVYTRDSLKASNHKKNIPICRLSLDSSLSSTNRTYMMVIDNFLFVTDDGISDMYVFNIASIGESQQNIPYIAKINNPGGKRMYGMEKIGNTIITARGSNSFDIFTITNFLTLDFAKPLASFSSIQGTSVGQPYFICNIPENCRFSTEKIRDETIICFAACTSNGLYKIRLDEYKIEER